MATIMATARRKVDHQQLLRENIIVLYLERIYTLVYRFLEKASFVYTLGILLAPLERKTDMF